ncbi:MULTISPECIES: hypothetical protein [unclassified Prochlorococcus]|uniref:hypothetical protein n=1 Tax=unclassified Prochlorococcus TaxID=2627481 RepID=UPI000B04C651|nr:MULTISPECIES: hypothetical protein [unclassified Prochlorococcus]
MATTPTGSSLQCSKPSRTAGTPSVKLPGVFCFAKAWGGVIRQWNAADLISGNVDNGN